MVKTKNYEINVPLTLVKTLNCKENLVKSSKSSINCGNF